MTSLGSIRTPYLKFWIEERASAQYVVCRAPNIDTYDPTYVVSYLNIYGEWVANEDFFRESTFFPSLLVAQTELQKHFDRRKVVRTYPVNNDDTQH